MIRKTLSALLVMPSYLRALWYRVTAPIFVRQLGRGSRCFGRFRLARPFSNIRIGARAMIGEGVFWQVAQNASVVIGDDSDINRNSVVVASESITIGNNVAIAEMVSIRDCEHLFDVDHGVREQGYRIAPIVIEDNVWIGRGVYIGPGTHIRRGSIVGANSVVRGEFPAGVLIAGAPATVKKHLA